MMVLVVYQNQIAQLTSHVPTDKYDVQPWTNAYDLKTVKLQTFNVLILYHSYAQLVNADNDLKTVPQLFLAQ